MIETIKSTKGLHKLQHDLASRSKHEIEIRVCSTGCRALGALNVCDKLEKEIAEQNLSERVRVVRAGCLGLCAGAVAVGIEPGGYFYQGVKPDDVSEIVEQTIKNGEVVERLCYPGADGPIRKRDDIPFFAHQNRQVLRNCGVIDPTSLADALANGAYSSVGKVLEQMGPEEVIQNVLESGLRGRPDSRHSCR